MKDRLLKFLTKEQLSSARFAEIIGVQPSSISHIISGRNKPGFDFIQKILINYPSLNAEWLITGKGNMLKRENIQGDLFSGEYSGNTESTIESKNNDANVSEESDSRKIIDSDTLHTNVNKGEKNEGYKSELNDTGKITSVTKRKFIEKIVIFYSDKSFTEYSPE